MIPIIFQSSVKDIQAKAIERRDSSVGWKLDAGSAFLVLPYLKILCLLLKVSKNPSPSLPTLTSISKFFSSTVFMSTIRSRFGVLSKGVPWLPWEPSRRSKLRRRSSIAGSMLLSFCRGLSTQRLLPTYLFSHHLLQQQDSPYPALTWCFCGPEPNC